MRMAVDSKPEELDEIDRRIVQLKIEREALRKSSCATSSSTPTVLPSRRVSQPLRIRRVTSLRDP